MIYASIGCVAFLMVLFIFALMKSAGEASRKEEEEELTERLNQMCAGRKEEDE